MTYELTCRIKAYIQPFERQLALQELEVLAGAPPRPVPTLADQADRFQVRSQLSPQHLARELVFWEIVGAERSITTQQSLRESTVNVVRKGVSFAELANLLPFNGSVPLPNRRCLRYATHGLHEYRGKFFPQLVRTLINVANVPRRSIVADPFCGSGTTAVETMLARREALGLDMNPLSVFVARTKCGVLNVKVKQLENAYEAIRGALLAGRKPSRKYSRLADTSETDLTYLKTWFHPRVLDELDTIYATVRASAGGSIRDFFLVSLSNVLRRVSWQKEDDLRIRKEVKPANNLDPIREFLEEVDRSTRLILAFLRQERGCSTTKVSIQEGDAKDLSLLWQSWKGQVDLVITSPPYATALPYLDTDRLSLCFLGLLPRSKHREWDHQMIGNREITDKTRRSYWERFTMENGNLPISVSKLVTKIHRLNLNSGVGFRRRNLPPLLYKYFADMRKVLISLRTVMKRGASAFIVVGNNHTIAGGKYVDIPTAKLLTDIAMAQGFKSLREIPMEMLVSRDLFRKNTIGSESILHVQKR
jgi:DNA modification methylase